VNNKFFTALKGVLGPKPLNRKASVDTEQRNTGKGTYVDLPACRGYEFQFLQSYNKTAATVRTVYDYRLDDQATGLRSSAEAKDFSFSLCILTSSEAHPAFYPVSTGILSPGIKRGRGVTLTTHPL
jgi:hypothetical protein